MRSRHITTHRAGGCQHDLSAISTCDGVFGHYERMTGQAWRRLACRSQGKTFARSDGRRRREGEALGPAPSTCLGARFFVRLRLREVNRSYHVDEGKSKKREIAKLNKIDRIPWTRDGVVRGQSKDRDTIMTCYDNLQIDSFATRFRLSRKSMCRRLCCV